MPIEFGSVGGVAAAFTVVDEFSDTLTRAEVMLRETAKAAQAFAKPAKKWSEGAALIGRVSTETVPKLYSLAEAAGRTGEALTMAFRVALDDAARMNVGLRRAAAAFAPIRSAATAVSGTFATIDSRVEKLDGLLQTAGDKMTFAATATRTMAAETADMAAVAATAAKAAQTAVNAASRVRAPRALPAPGGGGTMPPVRPPGGGGKGGGHGPHSWGSPVVGAGAAGGVQERLFSMPAFAAGFLGFEAFRNALLMQYHAAAGAELFDPAAANNPKVRAADEAKLTALALQTSVGTIYTAAQTAEAYDTLAGMLATAPAFQGPNKWQNFGAVAPIILRASGVATMRGLGSLGQNMTAMAWFAHLLGAYTPQSMTGASNELLSISERSHVTLPQLEKIMGYSVPLARGLGVSVSDTAMVTGALIQGGLGQKAGVAVARVLTGLLQTGGPITASLQNALDTLGPNAIKYKGKALKAHVAGLHALGILDTAGHLTVADKAGNIVWSKIIADIDTAAKKLPKQAYANAVYSAFGMRGSRAAMLFKTLGKLVGDYEKTIAGTPTAVQQQAAFAATTQQQLEQMIARLTDIGTILATGILPVLNATLAIMLPTFDWLDKKLGANPTAATTIGEAALGAFAGWMVAGPRGALIGAFAGATSGMMDAASGGRPVPKARGKPTTFVGTEPLGEWLWDHTFGTTTNNMTVNAPLNVQIDGSLLGADYATLNFYMQGWIKQHAQQLGDAVKTQIQKQQQHNKRQSFIDLGTLGGYAP